MTFDSSTTTGTVNTYLWDFGDGATSLAGEPDAHYAADGTYTVTLTVYGPAGYSTTTGTVEVSTLSITTAALADGMVGSAYSETVVSAGGIAPVTWSVTAGALPDGLTLDTATGVISGTPTTIETANFTIEATDSADLVQVVTQALTITIEPATLVITTATLPGGQVASAYLETVTATGGVYTIYMVGNHGSAA